MDTLGMFCLKQRLSKGIELDEIGNCLNLTNTGVIELEAGRIEVKYDDLMKLGLVLRLNGKEFDQLHKIWVNQRKREMRNMK